MIQNEILRTPPEKISSAGKIISMWDWVENRIRIVPSVEKRAQGQAKLSFARIVAQTQTGTKILLKKNSREPK